MEVKGQERQVGKEEKREENQSTPGNLFPNKPSLIIPPFPVSQRFRKAKLDGQFSKFFNMFKKLEVNIPFVEALAQMPNYVKFMKEIMSNKKKLDYGTISLSYNCSAIIQRKLLKKQRDPGNFTIPCAIGEHNFKKALCDLGDSINMMLLSVITKLNLGELTPTTLYLQMADHSLTYPQGILEDVLVKVDKFIF